MRYFNLLEQIFDIFRLFPNFKIFLFENRIRGVQRMFTTPFAIWNVTEIFDLNDFDRQTRFPRKVFIVFKKTVANHNEVSILFNSKENPPHFY